MSGSVLLAFSLQLRQVTSTWPQDEVFIYRLGGWLQVSSSYLTHIIGSELALSMSAIGVALAARPGLYSYATSCHPQVTHTFALLFRSTIDNPLVPGEVARAQLLQYLTTRSEGNSLPPTFTARTASTWTSPFRTHSPSFRSKTQGQTKCHASLV
jgi:hypothetical protein